MGNVRALPLSYGALGGPSWIRTNDNVVKSEVTQSLTARWAVISNTQEKGGESVKAL